MHVLARNRIADEGEDTRYIDREIEDLELPPKRNREKRSCTFVARVRRVAIPLPRVSAGGAGAGEKDKKGREGEGEEERGKSNLYGRIYYLESGTASSGWCPRSAACSASRFRNRSSYAGRCSARLM